MPSKTATKVDEENEGRNPGFIGKINDHDKMNVGKEVRALNFDGADDFTSRRISRGAIGALYNGSQFNGHQKSGKAIYAVSITFKHVDPDNLTFSGFLNIKDLVDTDITTFFTGGL